MGTPSPRKLFWIIGIQGAWVRIEGLRFGQLPIGPTPFETEKAAMGAAQHVFVGELHTVLLKRVPRAWLESVARGDTQAKVQVYRPERR